MSNNTASNPPPAAPCHWSEAEHTVQAKVSPELLAMTRKRRAEKQRSSVPESDLFSAGETLEHRIPDDLLDMVRGRREARSDSVECETPAEPLESGVPPVQPPEPAESDVVEVSQVRVRPGSEATAEVAVAAVVEIDESKLSPALVFAVVAWAALLGYCAFLGAWF